MTMTAAAMAAVSEGAFLELGMNLAGPSTWKRRNDEKNIETFVTHYGVSPKVCARVWSDLQAATDPSLRVGAKDCPFYLLLALKYLKCYPKDELLCGFFDIAAKSMRKWKNVYVDKLARLLEVKVSNQPVVFVFHGSTDSSVVSFL
jgi:hypothetical protein